MQRGNGGADGNPRVVFGTMLRHYRTRARLSQEQLGGLVYTAGDMIAKVERGERGASEKLVDALESLNELGSNGVLRLLWDQLKEHLTGRPFPGWFADWADREAQAVKFRWFELAIVPGLLQTDAYARALLTDRIGFNGDVDEAVAARMARQAVLERDEPPELFVVIDETVLHRPVGSPDVMAAQLKHLTQPPGRTILRVIPAGTGFMTGCKVPSPSLTSRAARQRPTWNPGCVASSSRKMKT